MPRIELQPSECVVVTGMGCVTPLGLNTESSWQKLIAGTMAGYLAMKHILGDPIPGSFITQGRFEGVYT